ncbi:MAG: DUF805 domain-containing protein [Myxococcales bacterium]|nr:DUF805 domain-containing protein [Myxococcales bacterium]
MDWYVEVLKKYADFSGRARRRDYWMFVLINFLIACALGVLGMMFRGAAVLSWLYSLAVLVPSLAVAVRRMHDIGKSGWWLLIGFIPLIGAIILLVWACTDGERGDNEYGPDPKSSVVDAAPA